MNKEPTMGDIVYCDRTRIDKIKPALQPFYGYVESFSNSYYTVILFTTVSYIDDLRMINSTLKSIRIPPAWFQDGSTIIATDKAK